MNVQTPVMTDAPVARGPDALDFLSQVSKSQKLVAKYQRDISAFALAPDTKKSLRRFNLLEAAELLPFPQDQLIKILESDETAPQGEKSQFGRRTFTIEEIHALREHLRADYPGHVRARRDPSAGEGLQVILTNNFKGGVAKTSSCTLMAQYFAFCGYRVLALDMDPQGSLSTMFGIYPELHVAANQSIYAAIKREDPSRGVVRTPLSQLIRPTHIPGLDIVPANIELTNYEFDVPLAFQLAKELKGEGIQIILSLKNALEEVSENYDIVIIDTPPSLGYTTLTAMFASTGIVTPLQAQMLDVASLEHFLLMLYDYVGEISQAMKSPPRIAWQRYLVTMFQENRGQNLVLGHLRSLLGSAVLQNPMVASSAVTDASSLHCSIFEVVPESSMKRQYDRATTSAKAFLKEIEEEILATWNRNPEI